MLLKVNLFLEWMSAQGYKSKSVETYRSVLYQFADSEDPVADVMTKILAPKTRHNRFSILRSYATWARDEDLLEKLRTIKRRLPSPRRKTPRPPLDPADYDRVNGLISPSDPVDLIIGMMAVRGFRVGDVVRLTREEIRSAQKTGVLAYEAKKGQRIEWGTGLFADHMDRLAAIGDAQGPWEQVADIISNGQTPETRRVNARFVIEHRCNKWGKKLGLRLYPHRLRRTVAGFYLKVVGGDVTKLMKWMGWQNVATAYGYVDHIDRDEIESHEDLLFKK